MHVKHLGTVGSLMVVLAAGPVLAQTAPPASPTQPPATQNPPAQPPAGEKPAQPTAPQPPFPEGAKVAYIFMQAVFSNSVEGKAATAKLQEWEKKAVAAIEAKTKEAQALQSKLQQGGTVLNDQARTQGERDLQKMQRDIQAMQEDAQAEGQQLRQQLLDAFSKQVNPIIEQVAKERGLHMVFTVGQDANIAWAEPGLNISDEVVRRFDAATKAAPKK